MVPVESAVRPEVRGWALSPAVLSHNSKLSTEILHCLSPCILFLTLNLKHTINTTSNHTPFPSFVHSLLTLIRAFMLSSPQNSNPFPATLSTLLPASL